MSETEVNIEDMKKLALLSGKLSKWHLDNLRNFILIALDNVKMATIQYDIGEMRGKENEADKRQAGYVIYEIVEKKRGKFAKSEAEMDKRFEQLTHWVRSLLWSDTKVEIKHKNKVVRSTEAS